MNDPIPENEATEAAEDAPAEVTAEAAAEVPAEAAAEVPAEAAAEVPAEAPAEDPPEEAAAAAAESTEAPAAAADGEAAAADGEAAADDGEAASAEESAESDREAIGALRLLSERLFARLCRRLPMRTFIAELQRIDRAVYFRYFKGYRPMKIDAKHVEKALRKEIFERENGLLAQLVIYNWDEAEWRLYGDLQKHIKAINEDVEAIEAISDAEADPIIDDLESRYYQRDVAIATLINGVRVSEDYVSTRFGALL